MTDGTLSLRRTVVCPGNVQIQNNVPNATETRDVETETIIQTDNVHIHTEIYSSTQLSSEADDESPGVLCPDFEHHEEPYIILHSSRSKSSETDSPDIDEDAVPIKCESYSVESKLKQVTKIQAVDAPSNGPQKDSWDEGTRLLSETGKPFKMRKGLCHPDCPNLRISRSTQLQQICEAGIEISNTLTVTLTDKVSMTSTCHEDTARNLATIPEEGSVCSTAVSAETQSVEDDQDLTDAAEEQLVQEKDEDAFVTDEESASVTQYDAECTEAPDTGPLAIEEDESVEKETTVPAPDTDPLIMKRDKSVETEAPAPDTNPLTIEADKSVETETPAPDTNPLTIEEDKSVETETPAPNTDPLTIEADKSVETETPAPNTDPLTIEADKSVETETPAPDTDPFTIEADKSVETETPAPDTDPLTIEADKSVETETPAPDADQLTIEEVEYWEQGTVVPTDSILVTNIPKIRTDKQKKLERSKWKSGAWIIPPAPTRLEQAETRSCAKLLRSSSSQLYHGECRETRCASNIRCAATSNLCYDEECPVDYCSSKTSSTYCRPRQPFTCDHLRAMNNAKRCSVAGNSACNRYNSNFHTACRISNDCWYPVDRTSHSVYTSPYTVRNCYTPAYCYSFNTW